MFSYPAHIFFLVWHWLTIFGTCVRHYDRMCRVHTWSQFDIDLWPRGHINRVYYMVFAVLLCDNHVCYVSVSPRYNVSRTFMTSVWPWAMTLILKLYFNHEFESGKIVFALWKRHTKICIRLYHHETTCCVHSWPLCDPDLWVICWWRWYPKWVLLTVFFLFSEQ